MDVDRREVVFFLTAMAVSRFTLLAILALLVNGQEFTDDVSMFVSLVQDPFALLVGATGKNGQHPPFLGILIAIIAKPMHALLLSDFYVIRITFILYEVLTSWFFWIILQSTVKNVQIRLRIGFIFLVLPMGWMTSTVMAQDEVIAACFIAAVLWLVATEHNRTALLLCGFGVVAAKIFLVVPLLVLVVMLPSGPIVSRAVIGFAPIVLCYSWVMFIAQVQGNAMPLVNFSPNAEFGVNIWVLLSEHFQWTVETCRRSSSLLTLVVALVPLALVWKNRKENSYSDTEELAKITSAMLLWIFSLFYHINPEYYIMCIPLLLLVSLRWINFLAMAVLSVVPWAVNFFYGVNHAMTLSQNTNGAKSVFVNIYKHVFSLDPSILYQIAIWLNIIVTVSMALIMTYAAVVCHGRNSYANGKT